MQPSEQRAVSCEGHRGRYEALSSLTSGLLMVSINDVKQNTQHVNKILRCC